MASLLHSAFNSMTSWLSTDGCAEGNSDFKFYCDCEKLIELIVEKAREKNNCVDIEQKQDEGQLLMSSPRHNKIPAPGLLKTSKVQPVVEEENLLTERLLRDRAESGDLGVRVGDGVLSLQVIADATEGSELLIKRVNNASLATLRELSEIPQYCSTIIAICFDATRDDLDRLENAVKGPCFCWQIGPITDDSSESKDEESSCKNCLSDEDFETFLAIARATAVLHVIQDAGF